MKIDKKRQKHKNITLILCIIILIMICAIAFYQQSLSYETKYEIITSSRIYNPQIINSIQINEMNCAYDSETNTWFFPQDIKDEGNNILMKTGIISDNYNVSFITDKTINGIGDNYYNIDFEDKIKVLVYSDDYYYETNLQFTGLPIINIKAEQEITQEDSIVYSEIIDPYFNERDSEQYIVTNANVHTRGKTSLAYEKKSLKYELIKEDGENRKKNLLGMRDDDDWVLDALYCDPSKIRNVICCDLWNEINSLNTTSEYDIDLECEFVEVFINDKYAGIYVLKEPVDAKQVGIEDTDTTSMLIKGDEYKEPYVSEESYNEIDTELRKAYQVYIMKYPKNTSNEKIISDFNYFLDKINPYYDTNINISLEYVETNFCINNFMDYAILVNYANCLDSSQIKNSFYYINEEGKIIFVPWDLDMSFGLSYKEDVLNPVTGTVYIYDYENFDKYYLLNKINDYQYNKKLKERYFYLRQNILSYENLENMCIKYKTLLINSGAYERDSKLYYNYDLEKEINDILMWSENRINYLDNMLYNL